jgi:hypothetical protein
MANLSTYYPAPITAADLGLGAGSNATFGSIQNTPIGSTTASSGSFTTLTAAPTSGSALTLTGGTVTASAPLISATQTWNNSGVGFRAINVAVTNTASATESYVYSAEVGGSIIFYVRRDGRVVGSSSVYGSGTLESALLPQGVAVGSAAYLGLCSNTFANDVGCDTRLFRDAADTLAQRRTTNAQTFRIYNTFTDANNHERGFLKWSSNVFQIGTEKGSGGGSAREIQFQTDGVTRVTISSGVGNLVATNACLAQTDCGLFNGLGVIVASNRFVGWTDGSTNSSTRDVTLYRDAANTLALYRGTNGQTFRIYNTVSGTGNVNFDRVNFRWASNEFIIDAEAGGTGTLRGIKIGSATTSLLGFYGATPVDQPATVADPAGGGTIDTEARTAVNAIIDRLQELGLIA